MSLRNTRQYDQVPEDDVAEETPVKQHPNDVLRAHVRDRVWTANALFVVCAVLLLAFGIASVTLGATKVSHNFCGTTSSAFYTWLIVNGAIGIVCACILGCSMTNMIQNKRLTHLTLFVMQLGSVLAGCVLFDTDVNKDVCRSTVLFAFGLSTLIVESMTLPAILLARFLHIEHAISKTK